MLVELDDEISSFKFIEYLKLVKEALKDEQGLEKVLRNESFILEEPDQEPIN